MKGKDKKEYEIRSHKTHTELLRTIMAALTLGIQLIICLHLFGVL
jgi:hypothetical protein